MGIRPEPARRVRPGDSFTVDELEAGTVELEQPAALPYPPSEQIRGESWLWTKGPPYPLDYYGRRPE